MNRRRFLTGGALLAAAGSGLALAPRADAPRGDLRPLPQMIPARVGAWLGSDDDGEIVLPPADERTMAGIYDRQLARVYRHRDGEEVLVVIACAASQTGGLLVHRPESCYPASGFVIGADRAVTIALAPDSAIAGRALTAESGSRIEQVLYWIRIGHDFPLTARAEQWAGVRAALRRTSVDGVLARFSVVTGDAAAGLAILRGFVAELYGASPQSARQLMAGES